MRVAFETTIIGWLTIIIGWVLTTLALLSVLVYIWSRRVTGTLLYCLEDILLYISFLLSLALMSLTTWAVVVEGQGQHQPAESRSNLELIAKSLLINEVLWGIVNTFLRIGAILFIRRIFCVDKSFNNIFNAVTIMLLAVSVAHEIAGIATSLAICQPISTSWDSTVMGTCGNEVAAYLYLEILAAIIDLAITVAPLPMLVQLSISMKTKWKLGVLFSLGSVVFIITGLRIAALNRVNSHDFSYDRGYIGFLSILGPLIAIICGCTTASAGIVYRRFRQRVQFRSFSLSKVVWSIHRGWSSVATRKDRMTALSEVISRCEPPESVPTLESFETKSVETAMSSMTQLQPLAKTQSVTSSSTDDTLGQPTKPLGN
ncbi:hypothetical protein HD806DRAFT_514370 [Xylariaceae sp. AK1471]|nr:hypothetical protein HD806DRAFT_514370 [Xylariaceae sp. AK1471]